MSWDLLKYVRSERLAPRTVTAYAKCLTKFEEFLSGREPTGELLLEYRDDVRARASAQTANIHLAAIKYASKRRSKLTGAPDFAEAVETFRVEPVKQLKALNEDEVTRILQSFDLDRPQDVRDRAAFTIGIRTGARIGGIAGIRLEDFESDSIVCIVLKGGKSHRLFLDSVTAQALGLWRDWLNERGIKSGKLFRGVRLTLDGYIVTNDYSTGAFYASLTRRAAALGIKMSPHSMRHTFISWCKKAGVPNHRIMNVTGHKSESMINLYTTDLEAKMDPISAKLFWPTFPKE